MFIGSIYGGGHHKHKSGSSGWSRRLYRGCELPRGTLPWALPLSPIINIPSKVNHITGVSSLNKSRSLKSGHLARSLLNPIIKTINNSASFQVTLTPWCGYWVFLVKDRGTVAVRAELPEKERLSNHLGNFLIFYWLPSSDTLMFTFPCRLESYHFQQCISPFLNFF